MRVHLSIDDGLIIYGSHLLVPIAIKYQILSDLYKSQQGSVHTKQQVYLMIYWPEINHDIDSVVLSCQQCKEAGHALDSKEQLIQKPKPPRLFHEVAANYCSYGGKQFLILVDCFTN